MRTESGDLAISFTLTAEEYRAAHHRQLRRSPQGIFLLVAGVLGILAGVVLESSSFVYFGLSCFLLLGLLAVLVPRIQTKILVQVQTMAFNPHGVLLADGEAETRSAWALFKAIDETPDLFLLVQRANNVAVVVPKRAFDSATEVDEFRVLARSALAAR